MNADGYVSTGSGVLDTNMFAYCGNNPVNMVDESGKNYSKALKAVISAAILGLMSAISVIPKNYRNNIVLEAEHRKHGTTNPANRKKHEEGAARKNRDKNRREKGDARRKPNPNKRRSQNIEPNYDLGDKVLSGFAVLGSAAAVAFLTADDATGIGAADDGAIPIMLEILWDSAKVIIS